MVLVVLVVLLLLVVVLVVHTSRHYILRKHILALSRHAIRPAPPLPFDDHGVGSKHANKSSLETKKRAQRDQITATKEFKLLFPVV
jgi:hypothetical protein